MWNPELTLLFTYLLTLTTSCSRVLRQFFTLETRLGVHVHVMSQKHLQDSLRSDSKYALKALKHIKPNHYAQIGCNK